MESEEEEDMDLSEEDSEEDRFEVKGDEAVMYSDAAIKLGFCKLAWVGGHVAVLAALLWCIFLLIRFTFLWRVYVYSRVARERSSVEASILVGTEVGLLSMAVLLAVLIPRLIMTWTTALVFEFFLGRGDGQGGKREMLVENGSKIAVDLSISTLKRVAREGSKIAFAVGMLWLLSLGFSKHAIYVEDEMLRLR